MDIVQTSNLTEDPGEAEWTPIEKIGDIVNDLDRNFESQGSAGIPIDERRRLLEGILLLLKDEQEPLTEALFRDLSRPKGFTTRIIGGTIASTALAHKEFENWAQVQDCGTIPPPNPGAAATAAQVRREPLGTALVIGTWNFPIPLVFKPLVSALAAGCPTVVKLCEVCVHTSKVMMELIEKYCDSRWVRVVYGGVPQSTALLEQKFGVIFYTGNTSIGKVIARAAAEHLTPCILELGGKNPIFVTKNADWKAAIWKILDNKFLNAGQFCVSPDYVLLDASIDKEEFMAEVSAAMSAYFGDDPQTSDHLGRIVSERHFDRVRAILAEEHGGQVLAGGCEKADRADLYIPPSVVLNPKPGSMLLEDELFGPILAVVQKESTDAMIRHVNDRARRQSSKAGHSLALYVFSEDAEEVQMILDNTRSGGCCINDCIVHMLNENLPFGGVGNSGYGCYHGIWGFMAFSHERAVLTMPGKMNSFNLAARSIMA